MHGSRWFLAISLAVCSQGEERQDQVIRGVDQAQLLREKSLGGYTVTEAYTVRNIRFNTSAQMTVEAVYRKGTGKTYRVVSRGGSAMLQSRILDKLLAEEAALSHGEELQNSRVISRNYQFKLLGEQSIDGRACDVLELSPRAKSPHLLKGRAWVDAGNFSLVRIEGKPNANVSFLAGRPTIVREYSMIDGFSLAKRSHAVSESLLLGRTELTIEYSRYQILKR